MRYIPFICCLALLACDDEGAALQDAALQDAAPLEQAVDVDVEDRGVRDAVVEDARVEDSAAEDSDGLSDISPVEDGHVEDGAVDAGEGCARSEAPLRLGDEAGLLCRALARTFTLRPGARLVITPPEGVAWEARVDDQLIEALDPIGPLDAPAQITLKLSSAAPQPFTLHAHVWFQTRVEGALLYEDRPYDPGGFTGERLTRPARGVEVVIDRDDITMKSAQTDEEGRWSFSLRYDSRYRYQLYARARMAQGEQRAEVRDLEGSLYALEPLRLRLEAPDVDPPIDLMGEGPINGALNIADTLWEATRAIAPFIGRAAPLLTIRWEDGSPFSCGSCFTGDTILLGGQVEDPDQFDDDIILHEFGHYFVLYHSADSSPGGAHRDRIVSPRLAYAEGLAYAFAGIVRDTPHIVDNFLEDHRHIDMELVTLNGEALDELSGTTDGTPLGDLREELVEGVLWDAYDPKNEPWDEVSLGAEGMFKLWTRHFSADQPEIDLGAPGIDLVDWLNVAACAQDLADELAPLAEARAFPWSAEDVSCQKGGAPLILRANKAGIALDEALPRFQVWRGPLKALPEPPLMRLKGPTLRCDAPPCDLGAPLGADEALIIIGEDAYGRRGGSLLGHRARELRRGGRVDAPRGLRRYPLRSPR